MADTIGTKDVKNNKQKEKLEKLKLWEIWEIITDKRFGIRFKIANLICRDYLRNYLAFANSKIGGCIDILECPYYSDEVKCKHIDRKLRAARKTLTEVFDF